MRSTHLSERRRTSDTLLRPCTDRMFSYSASGCLHYRLAHLLVKMIPKFRNVRVSIWWTIKKLTILIRTYGFEKHNIAEKKLWMILFKFYRRKFQRKIKFFQCKFLYFYISMYFKWIDKTSRHGSLYIRPTILKWDLLSKLNSFFQRNTLICARWNN